MFEYEIRCSRESSRFLPRLGNGGTLLDLGANIGEFSRVAANQFDRIIAVEAHPRTAKIAKRRTHHLDNVEVISAAVAALPNLKLYVSTPSRSTSATVRATKRLKRLGYYKEVNSIALNHLIMTYRPRIIKMDIEGSEWDVLPTMIAPNYLKKLLVEFHGTRKRARGEIARLRACGFYMETKFPYSDGWPFMVLLGRS